MKTLFFSKNKVFNKNTFMRILMISLAFVFALFLSGVGSKVEARKNTCHFTGTSDLRLYATGNSTCADNTDKWETVKVTITGASSGQIPNIYWDTNGYHSWYIRMYTYYNGAYVSSGGSEPYVFVVMTRPNSTFAYSENSNCGDAKELTYHYYSSFSTYSGAAKVVQTGAFSMTLSKGVYIVSVQSEDTCSSSGFLGLGRTPSGTGQAYVMVIIVGSGYSYPDEGRSEIEAAAPIEVIARPTNRDNYYNTTVSYDDYGTVRTGNIFNWKYTGGDIEVTWQIASGLPIRSYGFVLCRGYNSHLGGIVDEYARASGNGTTSGNFGPTYSVSGTLTLTASQVASLDSVAVVAWVYSQFGYNSGSELELWIPPDYYFPYDTVPYWRDNMLDKGGPHLDTYHNNTYDGKIYAGANSTVELYVEDYTIDTSSLQYKWCDSTSSCSGSYDTITPTSSGRDRLNYMTQNYNISTPSGTGNKYLWIKRDSVKDHFNQTLCTPEDLNNCSGDNAVIAFALDTTPPTITPSIPVGTVTGSSNATKYYTKSDTTVTLTYADDIAIVDYYLLATYTGMWCSNYGNSCTNVTNEANLTRVSNSITTAVNSIKTPTTEGTYYLWLKPIKDWGGQYPTYGSTINSVGPSSSVYRKYMFIVDSTAPGTPTLSGGTSSWLSSQTLTLSGTDDRSGVYYYCFKTSTTAPGIDDSCWQTSSTKSFTSTTNATYYGFTKDKSGNISAVSNSQKVMVDTTNPVTPTLSGGTSTWLSSQTLTLTGTDAHSGVSKYCIKNSNSTPGASDSCWSTSNTKVISTTNNINYYGFTKDAVGNISSVSNSQRVKVDKTNPNTPTLSGGTSTWLYNQTLTLTGTDNHSGVTYYCIKDTISVPSASNSCWSTSNTMTFTGTTTGSFYGFTKDAVGNVSSVSNSQEALVDRTAPSFPTLTGGTNSWLASQTLTITGTDNHSGVAYYCIKAGDSIPSSNDECWTEWLIGEDNIKTINTTTYTLYNGFIKDAVGNISDVSNSQTVMVDTTRPLTPNISGWDDNWTASQTIKLSGLDEDSGVAYYCFKTNNTEPLVNDSCWLEYSTTTTNNSLTFYSTINTIYYGFTKDAVGNISLASSAAYVKVDTTNPVTPTLSGGTSTWLSSQTLTITGIDAHSGVTHYCIITTNGTPSRYNSCWSTNPYKSFTSTTNSTYYGFTKDAVGNVSYVSNSQTVKVDRTKPVTPTLTGGSDTWGTTQTLTLTGTDAHSGVAYYCITTSTNTPAANDSCWQNSNTKTINSSSNEQYYGFTKDSVGNISVSSSGQQVKVDIDSPAISGIQVNGSSSGVVYTNDLNLTLLISASDVTSGISIYVVILDYNDINTTLYSGDSAPTSLDLANYEGIQVITLRVCDYATHCVTSTRTLVYDHTNPTVSDFAVTRNTNALANYTSQINLVIILNASDALSGINNYTLQINDGAVTNYVSAPTEATISSPVVGTTYTITIIIYDMAGNTFQVEYSVIYDNVSPVLSVGVPTDGGTNGSIYYGKSNKSVSISYIDGVALRETESSYYKYVWSKDIDAIPTSTFATTTMSNLMASGTITTPSDLVSSNRNDPVYLILEVPRYDAAGNLVVKTNADAWIEATSFYRIAYRFFIDNEAPTIVAKKNSTGTYSNGDTIYAKYGDIINLVSLDAISRVTSATLNFVLEDSEGNPLDNPLGSGYVSFPTTTNYTDGRSTNLEITTSSYTGLAIFKLTNVYDLANNISSDFTIIVYIDNIQPTLSITNIGGNGNFVDGIYYAKPNVSISLLYFESIRMLYNTGYYTYTWNTTNTTTMENETSFVSAIDATTANGSVITPNCSTNSLWYLVIKVPVDYAGNSALASDYTSMVINGDYIIVVYTFRIVVTAPQFSLLMSTERVNTSETPVTIYMNSSTIFAMELDDDYGMIDYDVDSHYQYIWCDSTSENGTCTPYGTSTWTGWPVTSHTMPWYMKGNAFTPSQEGTYYLYIKGNPMSYAGYYLSTTYSVNNPGVDSDEYRIYKFVIDDTAPVIEHYDSNCGCAGAYTNNFDVLNRSGIREYTSSAHRFYTNTAANLLLKYSATEDHPYKYSLLGSGLTTETTEAIYTGNTRSDLVIPLNTLEDGNKEITLILYDRAGNASFPLTFYIVYDTISPTISVDATASYAYANGGEVANTNTQVTVSDTNLRTSDVGNIYYYIDTNENLTSTDINGNITNWNPVPASTSFNYSFVTTMDYYLYVAMTIYNVTDKAGNSFNPNFTSGEYHIKRIHVANPNPIEYTVELEELIDTRRKEESMIHQYRELQNVSNDAENVVLVAPVNNEYIVTTQVMDEYSLNTIVVTINDRNSTNLVSIINNGLTAINPSLGFVNGKNLESTSLMRSAMIRNGNNIELVDIIIIDEAPELVMVNNSENNLEASLEVNKGEELSNNLGMSFEGTNGERVKVETFVTLDGVRVKKLDTNKAGVYSITYIARDKNGKEAKIVREVIVKEDEVKEEVKEVSEVVKEEKEEVTTSFDNTKEVKEENESKDMREEVKIVSSKTELIRYAKKVVNAIRNARKFSFKLFSKYFFKVYDG